ncbi:MAG: glutamine amidotransferase [Methanosphaera sp. rholeuAM130]|nr:MAG: glutamine amidotransferase [Methanosphaera sp. rholeuAM130]
MQLDIFHLYPDLLNLYGDTGNIKCLVKRAESRGITVNLHNFSDDMKEDLTEGDLFFIGGGSDRSQQLVYRDFLEHKDVLKELINNNKVVLAVCGGYQLLGREYIDKDGNVLPGLGILDYTTKSSDKKRIIGNIIINTTLDITPKTIVGFENHGGRTFSKYEPLGSVLVGYGNNENDKIEGVVYNNYIGTYLHGPILPKNPHLADYLILKALQNKYDIESLKPIDDSIEMKAHKKVLKLYG